MAAAEEGQGAELSAAEGQEEVPGLNEDEEYKQAMASEKVLEAAERQEQEEHAQARAQQQWDALAVHRPDWSEACTEPPCSGIYSKLEDGSPLPSVSTPLWRHAQALHPAWPPSCCPTDARLAPEPSASAAHRRFLGRA